ncbi:MAG: polysaccharide biosynthesis tyrosine autokinase [Anaerolineales bacterium]|nr:polysaccharide biosynthesis tyrosine autokinase [Anaerolineales bacterium]
MELRHYLTILWRRKWIILFTVAVATFAAAIGSSRLTPVYSATATMWVPASNGSPVGSGDILLNDRLMNTYAELTTSGPVLNELERQLGVSPAMVRSATTVRSVPQTELLQVTVQLEDPQLAANIATSLANIVIAQTQKTDAGRSLRVSLFAAAGVPDRPTWLGILATPYWREINILLGFVISLIAGVGLAFLFEYVDTTLYTTRQIEAATELETIGQIPVIAKKQLHTWLNGSGGQPVEAFRYLRTNLVADQGLPLRSLLVTSATQGEGKSTVVANLASAIAQSGRSVIVVDANLRQPALHKVFAVPTERGLSNLLQQEAALADVLHESPALPGVRVLTSGPLPQNPAELLDSPHTATVLAELTAAADYVLVDTPAVLQATDAVVLATLVDGIVLVVERARTHQDALASTRSQLAATGARLAGIVVNRTDQVVAR